MVFYNKDQFQEAGISDIPQTWNEFITDAKALQTAGYAPFTEDLDAYTDILIGDFAERAVTCQGIIDTVNDPSSKKWEDPKLAMMAEKVAELSSYLAEGTDGNLYPAGQQRVALGEVSMNLNGSWLPSELQDLTKPDFNWGVFAFPNLPDGAGSNTHIESGSQAIGINKASSYPDEAFELIRYIAGYDAQTAMTTDGNSPAARVDVSWQGPLADAYQAFKKADQSLPWACGLYDTGEIFGNVLIPNFKDLLFGKITPDEFIQKMTADQADFWASHEQ